MCEHMCDYAVLPRTPDQGFLEYVASVPLYAAVYKILDSIRRTGKYNHMDDDLVNFTRCPGPVATYLVAYGRAPAVSCKHSDFSQFLEREHINNLPDKNVR